MGRLATAVPLLVVAKTLGHADTRMVEKHLTPSYIVHAIRAGAPRFGAPASTVVPLHTSKSTFEMNSES